MGNKFSIDITLDHGNNGNVPIVAGTSLKGNVVVYVRRQIDPVALTLFLFGTETTIVSRPTKTTKEQKRIARAATTLRSAGRQKIPRGTYRIPFEFLLPSSLPSSTQFPKPNSRNFNGRIRYMLRAQMGTYDHDRVFEVAAAPLPSDIVPCMAPPTTHELKAFGMLNKGFLSVGAGVENSRVGKGQALRLSVASRNNASVDVDRVRIKLVELVEYHALGDKDTIKVELERLNDVNLPGLIKSRASFEEVRRSIRGGFQRDIEATYESIYQDLVSGENRFDVIVPETARDSYNGNLMTISHYIKVTFYTKALVENPSTKIPIIVGNPRQQEEQCPRPSRLPTEPIATVIFDDDLMVDTSDAESQVEVGSRAEDPPMADAVLLGGCNQSILGEEEELENNGGAAADDDDNDRLLSQTGRLLDQHNRLGMELPYPMPARTTPTPTPTTPPRLPARRTPTSPGDSGIHLSSGDEESTQYFDTNEVRTPPTGPFPSAPDEELLGQVPIRVGSPGRGGSAAAGQATAPRQPCPADSPVRPHRQYQQQNRQYQQPPPQEQALGGYSPYQLYTRRGRQETRMDYSYADSDMSSMTDMANGKPSRYPPPFAPPNRPSPTRPLHAEVLLSQLFRELNGSIHDYEVVATNLREREYQDLLGSLSPDEFGSVIEHVTMGYQVQVALLIAKQYDRQNFTCEHCAKAVSSTSEYFRSNMVETLLPYCHDLAGNKKVIQDQLSEWEQIITSHAFETVAGRRK